MTGYGRCFAAWRDDAGAAWDDYVRHDFVQGMADGTLPRQAFLAYLVQDYRFLIHFSRAWALGVVKAGTLAEMRACVATVDALLNHETSLHVRVCGDAGITAEALEAAEEAPENLAYTRYVLESGYSGDFLDLLAALAQRKNELLGAIQRVPADSEEGRALRMQLRDLDAERNRLTPTD